MAASFNESQKIDYLWKKVGYGVTKTAEPASKEAFNESIASPLLYRGDLIWTQSGDIPASPPANTTPLVQVYKDGGGAGYSPAVQCTEDLTAPDNQTWKTNSTNWIPTQFGDNYLVQVYAGAANISNPQTAGTKLFGAGSGSDDTWFFDYQSGVLNFNGATIPTAIGTGTANTIYIVGYRYVGEFGVDTTFISNGTSNVNIATANGNITMGVNGTGNVAVISNTGAYVSGVVSASGNVTSGNVITGGLISATANITGGNVLTGGVVSATGNVTGNYFVGNGTALTGVLADRGNDTNNWDILTQMGVYLVNRASWSGTQGTPLDSQVYVGLLQVQTSQAQTTTQIFYPGQVDAGDIKIQWNRTLWISTWTPWIKMTNDGQQISGGEF
jgi:hypothetical protein